MRRNRHFFETTALVSISFSLCLGLWLSHASAQEVITGNVTVPPSTLNDVANGLRVGDGGVSGNLTISGGGQNIQFGSFLQVGATTGDGELTIDNGARLLTNASLTPTDVGTNANLGIINLTSGGTLQTVNTDLFLGAGGTINMGANDANPAAAAGFLNVNNLVMSAGSEIVVNHNSAASNYINANLRSQAPGTGTITFLAGDTVLSNNNSAFSGTIELDDGATIRTANSNALTNATIEFTGGQLIAGVDTTLAGDVVVNASTGVGSGATFDTSLGFDFTITGEVSGTEATEINGGGIVTFSGTNTSWTGGLSIDSSEVIFSDADNLTTGAIELNTAKLNYTGTTDTITSDIDLDGINTIEVGTNGTLTASGDISGTGRLKKLGAGTLSLTGAGTSFSGGIDLAVGTVRFEAAANLGTGLILFYGGDLDFDSTSNTTVTNELELHQDGTLDISDIGVLTWSGDIKDGGGGANGTLTIAGGGQVNFSGGNTFSGGLIIQENSTVGFTNGSQLGTGTVGLNNGILAYTGNTNLLLSDFEFTGSNNTLLVDDGTVNVVISSTLTGTGQIEIQGGNTIEISGTNSSWRGGLTLSDVDFVFAEAANLGDGGIAVTLNEATFTYTGSGEATFDNLSFQGANNSIGTQDVDGILNITSGLSGSNQIEITGPGTVNLLGNNSAYTADLFLNSGVVGIQGFSTRQSGAGNIILGDGTLFYLGQGNETVDSTKLQVGSVVAANNTLNIEFPDANLTWTGNVAPGVATTFRKNGAGTLILSDGTKTFDAVIEEGTLQVGASSSDNAILDGPLQVDSDGILSGFGTVVGAVTLNGGSIAPGASFGTITLGSLGGTGDMDIEFGYDSTTGNRSSDQVIISPGGSADLSNITLNLSVVMGPNPVRVGDEFVILDSPNTSGTFIAVNDDMFMMDVNVLYGIPGEPDDVAIQIIRNSNNFESLADTRNQFSTTEALDSTNETGLLFSQLAPLTNTQISALLTPLAGEINASTRAILLSDSRFVRQAVNDRLYMAHSSFAGEIDDDDTATRVIGNYEMWGQVYGSWGQFFSDGNARTTNRNVGGLLLGVDASVYDVARAGVFAGFGRTSIDVSSIDASSDANSYTVGAYTSINPFAEIQLRGGIAGTFYSIATDRDIGLTPEERLSSDQSAGSLQLFGELGYNLAATYGNLEPFVGIAYAYLSGPGFNEEGGAAALRADSQSNDLTFLTLGGRGEFDLSDYLVGDTRFVGLAAWQYASAETLDFTQAFIDSGNPFTVSSVPIARNVALIEAGLESNLTANIQFNLNYYSLLASEAVDHGANARLFVNF